MNKDLHCTKTAQNHIILNNKTQRNKGASATFDYDGHVYEQGSTAPLNPHHTHFILVDNGKILIMVTILITS